MSFKDIPDIKLNYYSLADDIVESFYIPCLEQAEIYKRAVGYFSSNILLQISKGLGAFADNKGKMKLLVSTRLEECDYEAIKQGYEAKEYLKEKIIKNFNFNITYEQKEERFKMLSYMISSGLLEVKIVALKENNDSALYHDKIGYMEDADKNIIVFSGSGNETYNAFKNNYESFDVFCSWKSAEAEKRCKQKELNFDKVWNDEEPGLITIPFPEVIKNKLLTFIPTEIGNFSIIDKNFKDILDIKKSKPLPRLPADKPLRKYQLTAINEWANKDYKGIFDMATATGKTYAGAGAICRLFKDKGRLVVIICVPYIHLIKQWFEELCTFNIFAIECYSNQNYEKKLKTKLNRFKRGQSDFVCAILCNNSFKKESIQELLQQNLEYTLLLIDEAHNFGAKDISKTLDVNYPYRLALSATLERHNDDIGTKKLFDFFGDKCLIYELGTAISEGFLTQYYYYPIVVSLNESEYDEYINLSRKIAKIIKIKDKNGQLSEAAKILLIKRARIVSGAIQKISKLKDVIEPYKKENNILIYCGSVKYGDEYYDTPDEEKRQLDVVMQLLNNDLWIRSMKFTAEESSEERKKIIDAFEKGNIQALVAMKCLDEGINIPSIKRAFILASSTNPKQYIQRRGRVLRRAPNKDYAYIYDFITLPTKIDDASSRVSANLTIEQSLVKKELSRLIDFANLSKNPSDSYALQVKIKKYYKIDIITKEDFSYE